MNLWNQLIVCTLALFVYAVFWDDGSLLAASKPFTVFDALSYKGKPNQIANNMVNLKVIYEDELWNKNEKHDLPNVSKIAQVARTLKPGSMVCIDIECWPVNGTPANVNASIKKFVTVAKTIKSFAPTVKFGFYGTFPIRNVDPRVILESTSDYYIQWQQENDTLKPIADLVDYIFPSLYTLTVDRQYWKSFAVAHIAEARRYGKPVYPFLWPQYHPAVKKLSGQYIPQDLWSLELDTCYKFADGAVIWGGYMESWNDNAPWYAQLKKFLNSENKRGI